jgi:hypothetical protein
MLLAGLLRPALLDAAITLVSTPRNVAVLWLRRFAPVSPPWLHHRLACIPAAAEPARRRRGVLRHLDRLLESASKAKMEPPFPREAMRDVLIQTTAASGCKDESIKY